jgi:transposase
MSHDIGVTADDSHPPTSRPPTAEILRRENDRLRREKTRLERERDDLTHTNERLRKNRETFDRERERLERELERMRHENAKLRQALEAARRAGKRQAAPCSKGRPKAAPKRPGRKSGAAHGRHGHRPVPTHVDEVIDVPAPPDCPHCHGDVVDRHPVCQHQEHLPPVRPHVRAFRVEVGWCADCGRRVQGRHALQTSDALGAAAVQLGPDAIGLATILHTQLGLPVAKVAALFRQPWHLSMTAGGIIRAIQRVGQRAKPTYQALVTAIRQSPVVVPDETGWRENGQSCWEWVFATPQTTLYLITKGRGFADASLVLPADYAGTLVRDGWVAYRAYHHARHQSCLEHLRHRCETLTTDHPHSTFAPPVQAIRQAGLAARDRWRDERISDHGDDSPDKGPLDRAQPIAWGLATPATAGVCGPVACVATHGLPGGVLERQRTEGVQHGHVMALPAQLVDLVHDERLADLEDVRHAQGLALQGPARLEIRPSTLTHHQHHLSSCGLVSLNAPAFTRSGRWTVTSSPTPGSASASSTPCMQLWSWLDSAIPASRSLPRRRRAAAVTARRAVWRLADSARRERRARRPALPVACQATARNWLDFARRPPGSSQSTPVRRSVRPAPTTASGVRLRRVLRLVAGARR